MIPLNISIDSAIGATSISNTFIDDYMKDANDVQIKIYLYLLRMTSSNLPTDITEIQDKFNLTEKDLNRALLYWEKAGLLSITYDGSNNISGIRIHDLNNLSNNSNTNTANNVVTEQFQIIKEEPVQVTNEVSSNKMDYTYEKNNYSLDNIKALKKDPDFAMLINISSQYLSHPLSPVEIKSLAFIYDKLGFSMDLTDHLIEYVVDNGNKSFHYVEQTAIDWYEHNISSVEEAKNYAKKYNKNSYQIMSFLGKKGNITTKELSYINRWTNDFGFTLDIIEEACTRTVMRTDTNRFAYANTILEDWHNKNVHSISDVAVLDNNFQSTKKSVANNNIPSYTGINNSKNKEVKNKETKIEQRDYDFDELERLLISNQ